MNDEAGRELAVQIASDCLSEVPVMVLGSGASCAYGIRGMPQLAECLIERVNPSSEDVDCWDAFKAELQNRKDLEEALQTVSVAEDLHNQIVRHTRDIILEDERKIYDEMITDNKTLALTHLFQHLFRTTHKIINVVTTNYDRLVEYAACQAQFRSNTGFSEGAIRHFTCAKSEASHYAKAVNFRCVDVWKVHGSLDWFQNASTSPVGIMDYATLPDTFIPLIVTPGVAKYSRTHQDPFRSVIRFADLALSEARSFLCVGYGFSDDHIEPKLIQRSNDFNPPVVIITRTLRSGAKRFLAQQTHSKVVAFAKDGNGTRAYIPKRPDGVLFEGEDLWSLEGLLRKLGIQQ